MVGVGGQCESQQCSGPALGTKDGSCRCGGGRGEIEW